MMLREDFSASPSMCPFCRWHVSLVGCTHAAARSPFRVVFGRLYYYSAFGDGIDVRAQRKETEKSAREICRMVWHPERFKQCGRRRRCDLRKCNRVVFLTSVARKFVANVYESQQKRRDTVSSGMATVPSPQLEGCTLTNKAPVSFVCCNIKGKRENRAAVRSTQEIRYPVM
jgi:hypothetical protein